METNETTPDVKTSVEKVDLDIDSWLGAPGADSLIVPDKTDEKPNIFSGNTKTDISFLDEKEATKAEEIKELLDDIKIDHQEDEDIEDEKTKGRPKTDKSGLVGFLKKRIESKDMFVFDDFDETKQTLDDYLGSLNEKDVDELWQANVSNIRQEVASNTPAEFFQSLPEELQYAAKYVADGGTDLKGLFKALSQVEQVRSMDPTNEEDQETIVRSYLQATNFGDTEEIEEEVVNWKDLGQLEKKAKQFKPKLDLMQEELVQAKIAERELINQQNQEDANRYIQNVFEALRPGELNGMKLAKNVQSFLYNGLTDFRHTSRQGNPTNLLGHLLEKYQSVEPRHDLIAEALWLLSNPNDYRANLIRQGKNEATADTVRQLKTEQSKNKATSSINTDAQDAPRKIPRQTNIFKR